MKKSTFTAEYASLLAVIKTEREGRGITQEELARRLGVSQTFVSKCERGERRIDAVELSWFCQAIGISLVQVIRRAGLEPAKIH